MIRTVDLRGRSLSKFEYQSALPRATMDVAQAMKIIEPILHRVKNGDESDLHLFSFRRVHSMLL